MNRHTFKTRPCPFIPLLLMAGMLIGLRWIILPMAIHDLQALHRAAPAPGWHWIHASELRRFWIALGPDGQSYFLFIQLTVELAGQLCLFFFWRFTLLFFRCRTMLQNALELTWTAGRAYLLLIVLDKACWILLPSQIEPAFVLLSGMWNSRLLLEGLLWGWFTFLAFSSRHAFR